MVAWIVNTLGKFFNFFSPKWILLNSQKVSCPFWARYLVQNSLKYIHYKSDNSGDSLYKSVIWFVMVWCNSKCNVWVQSIWEAAKNILRGGRGAQNLGILAWKMTKLWPFYHYFFGLVWYGLVWFGMVLNALECGYCLYVLSCKIKGVLASKMTE